MFGLGFGELLLILLLAIIFIGPKKLPELAQNMGKGFREFQRAKDGVMQTFRDVEYENEQSQTTSASSQMPDAPADEPKKPV